jgi:hypothetical protein
MSSRRTMLAASSLIVLQVLGTVGVVTSNVSAQADQLVAVIVGENNQDACEVQYRKSNNDQWGEDSRGGPPQACTGGIVTAYIATE